MFRGRRPVADPSALIHLPISLNLTLFDNPNGFPTGLASSSWAPRRTGKEPRRRPSQGPQDPPKGAQRGPQAASSSSSSSFSSRSFSSLPHFSRVILD
eukprot:8603522-Pyramimonas_sp.AAC.1